MRVCQTGSGHGYTRAARWAAIIVLLLLFSAAAGAEKVEQLSAQGYVSDFAGVLDETAKQKLTELGMEVDQKAGAQIAVVTIHSLEGSTAQDFANRLFQKWGVGPRGSDRGVMILMAVDDRQYWTEVGYGLEPILPDGRVGGFGRQMLPSLRQGQYGAALLQMSSQIAGVIAQDRGVTLSQPIAAPPAETDRQPDATPFGISAQLILPLIFLLFFGGWNLLAFILAAAGVSRYRRGRGSRGGWWMGPTGGWSGGGRSSGGWGGGGFGGGSSGGGGAGGGW